VSGPRQWSPTPGPWTVAAGLTGREAQFNGLVVLDGESRPVAACTSPELPLGEQRANARAVAAIPEIVEALVAAEDWIGDQPRSPEADRVYRMIAMALALLRHGGRG
jgi:hypothetical protein